jgi:hypothetical protein
LIIVKVPDREQTGGRHKADNVVCKYGLRIYVSLTYVRKPTVPIPLLLGPQPMEEPPINTP